MGWGDSAGFPAQLARFWQRDVDVIARNGSGATATRRELARRPEPLLGKTVVVWEFAARELMRPTGRSFRCRHASGPANQLAAPVQNPDGEPGPLVLEGTIVATSRVPQPFTVPYKDCLTYIEAEAWIGWWREAVKDDHMIAVFWGMKDNVRLTCGRLFRRGSGSGLNLVPMRKAPVSLQNRPESPTIWMTRAASLLRLGGTVVMSWPNRSTAIVIGGL